jgi:hypothetical protein
VFLLIVGVGIARPQQQRGSDSRGLAVKGEPNQPTVQEEALLQCGKPYRIPSVAKITCL